MQVESSNTRWTFARMVAELPPESRYELHNGVLLDLSPSPSRRHQKVLVKLLVQFHSYLEKKPVGEVLVAPIDAIFSASEVIEPDLLVLLGEPRDTDEIHIHEVPDLLLEILSPGSSRRDRVEKHALYAQYGVKEYWIVDPETFSIEVYTLVAGIYELHSSATQEGVVASALLPGMEVQLVQVF